MGGGSGPTVAPTLLHMHSMYSYICTVCTVTERITGVHYHVHYSKALFVSPPVVGRKCTYMIVYVYNKTLKANSSSIAAWSNCLQSSHMHNGPCT